MVITIGYIIQTCGIGFILMLFLKMVLRLRKLWLKAAIKTRETYNKKHKLHPRSGLGEVDTTSLSYQIDSIEGGIVFVVLFIIGLLFSIFVPLQNDNLFCIVSTILLLAMFFYCWFARNSGTKMYQVLVYIFCMVSLLLSIHIVVSLVVEAKVLIEYTNSFNALLYIWFAMLMYKLLIDRKE